MKNYTVDELRAVNPKYEEHVASWRLFLSVYKGIQTIVKRGYIPKHEREPQTAYDRRVKELYSFGYSKSVVKILTFHLFNKPPSGRQLKALENNELWELFFNDSNLQGDTYDIMIRNVSLYASIFGHMGILVDRAEGKFLNKKEQKDAGVYPYVATYQPNAILDWKWGKDENKRPVLQMVKLLDNDGTYRIWTREEWAVYKIVENGQTNTDSGQVGVPIISVDGYIKGRTSVGVGDEKVEKIGEGRNPLEEVPFFWFYNLKTDEVSIGESDIEDISRIDISIIKNCSQIEEIINFAAFPMMRKPRMPADPSKTQQSMQDDEVSVQIVQEFDPEFPESKPEWMKPEVESAIASVLDTITKKVTEIYRAANIGGITTTETSTQAKSGVALKTEFQMLNSSLVFKSTNLEKAENKILELFLKWENEWEKMKNEVHFGRAKSFNVEDVALDLANALTANTIVMSTTFNSLLQKQSARQVLPSMSEDEQNIIDEEIDANVALLDTDPTNTIEDEDEETQEIIDQENEEEEDEIYEG